MPAQYVVVQERTESRLDVIMGMDQSLYLPFAFDGSPCGNGDNQCAHCVGAEQEISFYLVRVPSNFIPGFSFYSFKRLNIKHIYIHGIHQIHNDQFPQLFY